MINSKMAFRYSSFSSRRWIRIIPNRKLIKLCTGLVVGLWMLGGCSTAQMSSPTHPSVLVVAALNGNPKAQYRLGQRYEYGHHFPKAIDRAFLWYRRAALNGVPAAQYRVALMHQLGEGTAINPKRAVYWYRRAAAQSYPSAQVILPWHTGEGAEQNQTVLFKEILQWYRLAAAAGDADAQFGLGVMYESGQGVERDEQLSQYWYRLAAINGHTMAAGITSTTRNEAPQN